MKNKYEVNKNFWIANGPHSWEDLYSKLFKWKVIPINPGTRFDQGLSSYLNENKIYSGNPSFTYHSLWSILQTWQGTKANPGSPVLYTVAIYATFENMNSKFWVIWAAY